MIQRLLVFLAIVTISGCTSGETANVANAALIEDLESRLALANALQAKAEADAAVAKFERDQQRAKLTPTVGDNTVATERYRPGSEVAMCYKDYCPCDPPVEGPDMPLCDQLGEGIQPDVELMIAARAMREARRQIEAADY